MQITSRSLAGIGLDLWLPEYAQVTVVVEVSERLVGPRSAVGSVGCSGTPIGAREKFRGGSERSSGSE